MLHLIKKKTFLTRIEVSLFCVTGISCWAQKFPTAWRCTVKKVVLGNFAKLTGKRLCQSLFFNKVAGLRSATLLKKTLWHRFFPANLAKFLGTPFFIEHLWAPASVEISVLKNLAIFIQKSLCWSLFFNKRLQHMWFSVNITKFLRTSFLIEHHWWLLL